MIKLQDNIIKQNYKLIISKNQEILFTSKEKGIKVLYELIKKTPEIMLNSDVFDTVVGKAAGQLYVFGKIHSLKTNLITRVALELLEEKGIKVEYKKMVPNIFNLNRTDLCPIEKIALKSENTKELLLNLESFFN